MSIKDDAQRVHANLVNYPRLKSWAWWLVSLRQPEHQLA